MTSDDYDRAARFAASLQANSTTQYGMVGTDPIDIRKELVEYQVRLLTDEDGTELTALVGIDWDLDLKRAYLFGPWVASTDEWDARADDLWGRAWKLVPEGIDDVDMAVNERNERGAAFATRHGFERYTVGALMRYDDDGTERSPIGQIRDASPKEFPAIVELHDRLFPGTWLPGKQLVTRLSEQRRLFVIEDGGDVIAYAYVEAVPEAAQGSIDFLGVHENARGRGLGALMVEGMKQWLLAFEQITFLELFVRDDNPAARRIYEKAGYREIEHIVGLRKQLT